jgi:hypothetical protein
MYDRQLPHLYNGGDNLKYYLTPSPADFLTRRAALRTNSIGPQPSHKGDGWGEGVGAGYIIFSCLWSPINFPFFHDFVRYCTGTLSLKVWAFSWNNVKCKEDLIPFHETFNAMERNTRTFHAISRNCWCLMGQWTYSPWRHCKCFERWCRLKEDKEGTGLPVR